MADSWSCVTVEKGPGLLDDAICAALKKAACALSLKGLDAMIFKEKICEGRIETEWKSFSFGTRNGILFRTEVDADGASFRVNFLLNRQDLERGEEVIREQEEGDCVLAQIPYFGELPPELSDFSDLRFSRTFH